MVARYSLLEETDRFDRIEGVPINWLAYAVWASDVNLQSGFDLNEPKERQAFLVWLAVEGPEHFGLDPSLLFVPEHATGGLASLKGQAVRAAKPVVRALVDLLPDALEAKLRPLLRRQYLQNAGQGFVGEDGDETAGAANGQRLEQGLNFVGYARSSLGLGEHLRTMVGAYASQSDQLAVLDTSVQSGNRADDDRITHWLKDTPVYDASHVVCAPEQTLRVLGAHGLGRFVDHPLIATWAWELERMPTHWSALARCVDHFWVASPFIGQALERITDRPVSIIPPAVEPGVPSDKGRGDFGLPTDRFLYLAHFDCRSWLGRKNPFAVVRAFKQAFPQDQSVGLVLKAMSVDKTSAGWKALMEQASGDDRIRIIEESLPRGDMLALLQACDVYVSLHRSEGFGFGPAEAMYFGKPVIVTDYSATADFCDEGTAFPVAYDLVPVEDEAYPHAALDGVRQVWADASVEQAAVSMRIVRDDPERAARVAAAGQARIRQDYSAEAIGHLMQDSLAKILTDR